MSTKQNLIFIWFITLVFELASRSFSVISSNLSKHWVWVSKKCWTPIFKKTCKTYCTLKESFRKTAHIFRSVKRIPTNNLYSFSIPICKQWSYKNWIEHFPNLNLSADPTPLSQNLFQTWCELNNIKYQKSSRHYRQSFISKMQIIF